MYRRRRVQVAAANTSQVPVLADTSGVDIEGVRERRRAHFREQLRRLARRTALGRRLVPAVAVDDAGETNGAATSETGPITPLPDDNRVEETADGNATNDGGDGKATNRPEEATDATNDGDGKETADSKLEEGNADLKLIDVLPDGDANIYPSMTEEYFGQLVASGHVSAELQAKFAGFMASRNQQQMGDGGGATAAVDEFGAPPFDASVAKPADETEEDKGEDKGEDEGESEGDKVPTDAADDSFTRLAESRAGESQQFGDAMTSPRSEVSDSQPWVSM